MTVATMPSSRVMPIGQDFDLFPMPSELTIVQAATILGSREGLIHSLIEDGDVAACIVDGELMVDRDSFLIYKQERDRINASMAEMVRWDQEMGLYD